MTHRWPEPTRAQMFVDDTGAARSCARLFGHVPVEFDDAALRSRHLAKARGDGKPWDERTYDALLEFPDGSAAQRCRQTHRWEVVRER